MALHGGQCRALVLTIINHAQRFTSVATTSDDSIIRMADTRAGSSVVL